MPRLRAVEKLLAWEETLCSSEGVRNMNLEQPPSSLETAVAQHATTAGAARLRETELRCWQLLLALAIELHSGAMKDECPQSEATKGSSVSAAAADLRSIALSQLIERCSRRLLRAQAFSLLMPHLSPPLVRVSPRPVPQPSASFRWLSIVPARLTAARVGCCQQHLYPCAVPALQGGHCGATA